jgi:hypothetical protein
MPNGSPPPHRRSLQHRTDRGRCRRQATGAEGNTFGCGAKRGEDDNNDRNNTGNQRERDGIIAAVMGR